MSNYTPTTSFGPKDSLPNNDPNKTIFGAAYDTEFNNIASAIATKVDTGSAASLLSLNVTGAGIPANGVYLPSANTLGFSANTTAVGSLTTAVMTMPAYAVTGATVPANGVYLPAANTVGIASNATLRWSVNGSGNHVFVAPSSGNGVTAAAASGSVAFNATSAAATQTGYALNQSGQSQWQIYQPSSSNDLRIWSTTDKIIITNGGNVTSNPPSSGSNLTLAQGTLGAVGVAGLLVTASATNLAQIIVAGNAATPGTNSFDIIQNSANGVLLVNRANAAMSFYTKNTDRVDIAAAGNVTLNTPDSGDSLTINTVANGSLVLVGSNPSFWLTDTNGTTQQWRILGKNGTTVAFRIYDQTRGADTITINSSGAISVQGATSGATLSVSGAALTPTNSIAFSATPTVNAALSNVHEIGALTANITTLTISNPTAGQTITIRFKQDGTGGRTVATPSGAKITGAIAGAANTASLMTLTYSSADSRWEGAITQLPT